MGVTGSFSLSPSVCVSVCLPLSVFVLSPFGTPMLLPQINRAVSTLGDRKTRIACLPSGPLTCGDILAYADSSKDECLSVCCVVIKIESSNSSVLGKQTTTEPCLQTLVF